MTVNKLERFAQIADFDHVLEYTDFQNPAETKPKGRWNEIFGNRHPIILELGCGTGAYALELARRHPEKNYIGVDIKGARMWKGAKKAMAEDLSNIRFLRIFIDHIDEYFAENEVDEIWITFADPYSRAGDRNKRLTAPQFLTMYRSILKPQQPIHFKTDDTSFYKYSYRSVKRSGATVHEKVDDIYEQRPEDELLTIQTDYEKKHLQKGRTISYLQFSF